MEVEEEADGGQGTDRRYIRASASGRPHVAKACFTHRPPPSYYSFQVPIFRIYFAIVCLVISLIIARQWDARLCICSTAIERDVPNRSNKAVPIIQSDANQTHLLDDHACSTITRLGRSQHHDPNWTA